MNKLVNSFMATCLMVILPLGCERKRDQVRIGALVPLTGEGASYGLSARRGFELAAAEWNARGGVLGKPVRLIVADDKGDPAEGVTAVTVLIHQRKVAGVLGPAMTQVALAGAPVAQRAGVPLVASATTHAKVTQVGDFIFRACYVDAFQGRAGAGFAFHDLKARKAGCIFDQGHEYPSGIAEVFRTTFTRLGGDVVAFEGHATGTLDFRQQLARTLRAAPDVIYVPDFYGDAALIAQQARELGYRGPILGADGWDSPKLLEFGRRHMENTFFTTFFSPEDPSLPVQDFVQAFRGRYGVPPDGHAAMGYEAAVILLDGIRRAGSTQGRAVRDAIARTDLRLVTGRTTFDAQRNPIKPIVIMEIKGGRARFRTARSPGDPDPRNGAPSAREVGNEIHRWQ
jgi:branched-chain amino acid transport system substrate-binding protein